jgi:hypothetical protein
MCITIAGEGGVFHNNLYNLFLPKKLTREGKVIHRRMSHLLNCGKYLDNSGKVGIIPSNIKQG